MQPIDDSLKAATAAPSIGRISVCYPVLAEGQGWDRASESYGLLS